MGKESRSAGEENITKLSCAVWHLAMWRIGDENYMLELATDCICFL